MFVGNISGNKNYKNIMEDFVIQFPFQEEKTMMILLLMNPRDELVDL